MLRLLCLVLCTTALGAPLSKQVGGIPLPKILEHVSKNGELNVTLTVMAGRLGADLHGEGLHPLAWDRRSFDGQPNGPTIRVRRGDTLRITLINDLGTEPPGPPGQKYTGYMEKDTDNMTNFSGSWAKDYDVYSFVNHTNLHLHGMHVSPAGRSDNVSRHLPPGGGSLEYLYQIPVDHPTGLFWYHPHYMGSSAVQLASGMAGALVVEDEPGADPLLDNMEEVVMVLHEVSHDSTLKYTAPNNNEMRKLCYFCQDDFSWASGDQLPYSKVINDPLFSQCDARGTKPDASLGLAHDPTQMSHPVPGLPSNIKFNAFDCSYMLVNGAYSPTVALEAGKWQRWRIVQAAANSAVRFHIPGCKMAILAHDGYYLKSPRPIPDNGTFSLMAGSRADLGILCDTPGTYDLRLEHAGIHLNGTEFAPPFNRHRVKEMYEPVLFAPNSTFGAHRTMLTVSVSGSKERSHDSAAGTVLPTSLPQSSSLRDISADEVTARYNVTYNLTAYGTTDWHPMLPPLLRKFLVYVNGGQFSINGLSFVKRPTRCMIKGGVEEWTVRSATSMLSKWMHSFHIHVNPFQIVSWEDGDPTQMIREDMQVGDWRDTVHIPDGGSVTFRFRNADFTGMFPFHCHVVAHQDIGMMQNVIIVDKVEDCPEDLRHQDSY